MKMKQRQLEISQVEIIPFRPRNGHLGFAALVINNQFYLGDIALFSRPTGGIRLAFPVKRLANGGTIDVCKPITQEVEKCCEEAVLKQYESLMNLKD